MPALRRRRARHLVGAVTTALLLSIVASAAAVTATAGPAAATVRVVDADGTVGGDALASHGIVVDAKGAPALPKVAASSYLLADLTTGDVLAAKDPHGVFRPASTLKILTALTLLPRLDPTTVYTATDADARAEGSRVGMVPGATYTVAQLLQALMLVSGNDAASGLASVAGGSAATVAAMSATATSLGARDTVIRNPSGLDAPGQLTSAYDLAVITRAAMARPDFRTAVSTVRSRFPGKLAAPGKVRKTFEIYTQDRLLLNYPGAIGIKTGFTTLARATFVGAATRNGHSLVAVVLHSPADGWRDSAALLTWGFANGAAAHKVGTLVAVPPKQAATVARHGAKVHAEPASSRGGLSLPSLPSLPTLPGPRALWALPLLRLLAVAILRARVLMRRERTRSAYGGGLGRSSQAGSRRVRLETRSASPAPNAAPMTMPRTVKVLPPPGSVPDAADEAAVDDAVAPTRTGS